MRKLIIGAATAVALIGTTTAAGAATAVPLQRTPVTNPLGPPNNGGITLPDLPNGSCAFPVDVAVVANHEFQEMTKLPDGSMIMKITGNLVLSFKNDKTGKTIQENVSGPSTTTVSPNGNGTFQGGVSNWFAFGPDSQKKTGEPGLVFTKGNVTVTFSGTTTQTFSLNGTQQNGCALLS